jgi:hypothetical protein
MANERSERRAVRSLAEWRATVGGSELIPEKFRKDEEIFGIESLIRSITVSDLYREKAVKCYTGKAWSKITIIVYFLSGRIILMLDGE